MQAQSPASQSVGASATPLTLPSVFMIGDDPPVHESMALLIRSEGWFLESYQSAEDFLARPRATAPSCLLLDVSGSQFDGLALQEIIADRTETALILVSAHRDTRMKLRAMKAGAVDLLATPLSGPAALSAIRVALDRSRRVLAQEAALRALQGRYALLSRREREVLGLVVSGLLNKQIAAELGISEITVKAHRGKMMRKMVATSLAELVNMAARLGPSAAVNRSTAAWRWLPLPQEAQPGL
jgi:FixJ family two-component response regulator